MELVLFIGIQATGKSTFYKQKLVDTHIRLNLDMLKTRNRESILLDACLKAKQPCVIDNTNSTKLERARYMEAAREYQFAVRGIFFASGIDAALRRNQTRAEHKYSSQPNRLIIVGVCNIRSRIRIMELKLFAQLSTVCFEVRENPHGVWTLTNGFCR